MPLTMSPSEAVYRQLKNAAAVLETTHGLSDTEVDAAIIESFALFFAQRAIGSHQPRTLREQLLAAIDRHLDNHGLSTAVLLPVRGVWARLRRRAA